MPKNMLQIECDRYWYSHHSAIKQIAEAMVLDDNPMPTKAMLAARFEAGVRWGLEETTKINPAITKFIELVTLLGFADAGVEQEASGGTESDTGKQQDAEVLSVQHDLSVSSTIARDDTDDMRQMQSEDSAG